MESAFKRGEKSVLDWIQHYHSDYSAGDLDVGLKEGNPSAASFMKFQAFTTAAVQDQRVRTRIQAALAGNLKRGEGARPFREVVDSEFDKAGLTRLAPHQIDNIYRTNTSLAYSAGQMQKMIQVSDDFPYWKYSATMDDKTRPDHAALHGKIFRTGDFTFWPPIGFRCRCTAIPLTARQASQYLKTDMPSPEERKNLQETLGNAEFIGNKNEKYMKWLVKEYGKADQHTQKLIDQALEDLKKDIKAQKGKNATISYNDVIAVEEKIRMNKSFETAVLFDANGKEFFRKKGGKSKVGFTADELQLFRDSVFTHNHPAGWGYPEGSLMRVGNSFSNADVLVAAKYNVSEVRAVTPYYTFVMKRPKNGWPETDKIRAVFVSENSGVKKYMMGLINKAEQNHHRKTLERASALHFHLVWKRACKKLGIEYTKLKTRV
jgi:SPP1 gp7 family putative phage head morphogenesis protein